MKSTPLLQLQHRLGTLCSHIQCINPLHLAGKRTGGHGTGQHLPVAALQAYKMPLKWLSCFTGCARQDSGEHSSQQLQQEQLSNGRQPEDVAHYYSQVYRLGSESITSSASSVPPEMSSVLIVLDGDGQLVPRTRTQLKTPGPSRFSQSPSSSPFAVQAHCESTAERGPMLSAARPLFPPTEDTEAQQLQISRQDSAESQYASCESFFSCDENLTDDAGGADSLLLGEWELKTPATAHAGASELLSVTHTAAEQRSMQWTGLQSTQGHILATSSELHSIPVKGSLSASHTHYTSLLATSSLSASKSKELRSSSHGSTRLPSWQGNGQPASITFTPEQQHKHVAVLQQMLHMYQQHGNPCEPCKAMWRHCRDAGIKATDMLPLIPYLSQQQQQLDSSAAACKGNLERAVDAQDRSGADSYQHITASMHLTRLLMAVSDMDCCLSHVMDDQGWQVVREDALQLFYRHKPGSSIHSFKARATLNAPIEHLMALTREFDLCSTWNHHCVESVILHEWSFAELLCCAVMWLPWPLPNASLVVEAVGMDLLETHGGFLVTFATPRKRVDGDLIKRAHLAKPSNMWIKILAGSCMYYEPLPGPGGPRTRATVETHTDAGIKLIPGFVITFVLKVMAPFIYNMAVKLMTKEFSDPSTPLPSRIPQRPELYNMIRDHTAAYLKRRATEA